VKELSKNYSSSDTEDKIFSLWEQDGYFHIEPDGDKEAYSIVIPPPNVTGVLHMGHALNATIQDIMIRKSRMDGFNVKWVAGTDHAGIATQNVVERKLKKENITRYDLGREKFLEEVWKWKEEHGGVIINQLKKLGASCDYEDERFTMDKGLALAVRECFVRLYEKKLIYRGNRIIHWCPRCLTALSDEEAEHFDTKGKLYTLHYHFKDEDGHIAIATTRPETLLGDTAVAVNPDDERFKNLIGKKVIVPFVNREIPIIADDFVDPEFGTGLVKVTPAHDPNDFEMGLRHDLEQIAVIDNHGIMNENAGPYKNQDRFVCRKQIIKDLQELEQLESIDDHDMAIRKCYRCATIIEPLISKQWFVKMKPMADKALKEFQSGKPEFYPKRFGNIYKSWLTGIRDWCISRQIWWGHQIPVWYCEDCSEMTVSINEHITNCSHCDSKNIKQDTDVLDTWFSSWLWPLSTLGWPEKTKELAFYYPTNILVTAQEIIFFWVARMVMAGLEFNESYPFEQVYIHGTVRDDAGLKMSKSYGNVIDPLKIINEFGADALRFSLMIVSSRGNDIYISDKKFEIGRNFATKIWNASRFLLSNLENSKLTVDSYKSFEHSFSHDDKLILYKTQELINSVDETIKELKFNDTALCLYEFFKTYFCDRYIESVKSYLYEESENSERSLSILYFVLTRFFLCVHPVMPFISEELWQILREIDPALDKLIAKAKFPEVTKLSKMDKVLLHTEEKYELLKAGRNLKKAFNISPKVKVAYIIKTKEDKSDFLKEEVRSISQALKASAIKIVEHLEGDSPMPSEITPLGTIFMVLDKEMIDFESEKKRVNKKIEALDKFIGATSKKLSNEKFLQNAKPEVVEEAKEKFAKTEEEKEKLLSSLKFFS